MKVKDLIELLEDQDPEANVFLMTQQSWPFENAIEGIAVRVDFQDADDKDTTDTDVFIVEGHQLRYGSKEAWEVCSK